MAAVCESPVEHYTHRESASSFSFCVRAWVQVREVFFFVYDLYSLLPASIKSDPTTRRAAMHNTPGAISLIVYAVWFGLSEMMMIWQRHTAADMLWYCACTLSLLWMNWLNDDTESCFVTSCILYVSGI